MILISMQGADGSSSAFVNNIHIVCKAKENEVKKTQTIGGTLPGFCLFSFIVQI